MRRRSLSRVFMQTLTATPRSACVALLLFLLFDMRLFVLTTVVCGSSTDQGGKPRSIIYAVIHHEVYSALSRLLPERGWLPNQYLRHL